MEFLSELNEQQRQAVTHVDGPLLVVAGAGSGKTRVLTYRIAHLIASGAARPGNILAVTFTNKAASEMRSRVEKLVGPRAGDIWVGTFHATCVQILRREANLCGYPRDFVIFDGDDQLNAIKESFRALDIDQQKHEPKAVLHCISAAKNELIGPAEYCDRAGDAWEKLVGRVYVSYQERLRKNAAFDFDDLIMTTVELFQDHPDVLEKYQDRFKYILVDEYQDTNHAQYVLVNLLAQKHRNLCCVGDEDQSIFGWRGADIRNILDFERDYPDCRVIKLEENYRSTKRILAAANSVIKNNLDRKSKNLWTRNPTGDKLVFAQLPDEKAEASFVAAEIERLSSKGPSGYRDFTILYRTHAQSRAFEEEFMKRGIPYKIVAGLRFYERKEIKDVLAYLRVIYNTSDEFSLRRVINVPKRGIGAGTLSRLEAFANFNGLNLWEAMFRAGEVEGLTQRFVVPIKEFCELIEGCRKLGLESSVTALTEAVLERTGYLRELEAENTEEARGRIENLRELLTVTKQFDRDWSGGSTGADSSGSPGEGGDLPALGAFLERVALVADSDAYEELADVVSLMTLHSAKGLEFPVVFMVGMEDGLFPHSRALFDSSQLEEERRLCYVGLTRAKQRVYLTATAMRTIYGMTNPTVLSQFISEVPSDLLETRRLSSPSGSPAGWRSQDPDAAGDSSAARLAGRMGSGGYRLISRPDRGVRLRVIPGGKGRPAPAGENGAADAAGDVLRGIAEGKKVRHDRFGEGIVVQIKESGVDWIVTVAFRDAGLKKLLASIANLKPVED